MERSSCLLILLVICAGTSWRSCQAFIRPAAVDGDTCRTWTYTSEFAWFAEWLQKIVGKIPCPDNKILTSDGRCVAADDPTLDRCLNPRNFTQAVVTRKCQKNPKAIFADPLNCSRYYNCSRTPASVQCPPGLNYDDINKQCDDNVLCSERPVNRTQQKMVAMCSARPTLRTASSGCCNVYFDCSDLAEPKKECKYPEVYDLETKTCKPFSQVDCKLRPPEKNPCELSQMRCGRSAHCMPCELNYPDCSNHTDGNKPIPLKLYSPQFVVCQEGWNVGVKSCEPAVTSRGLEVKVFDARDNSCRSIYNVPRSLGGLGPDDTATQPSH